MKVGDYVRTEISSLNLQRIGKIKKIISEDFIHTDIGTYDKENIIKSSPNIIDLIEVGDYVNGHAVKMIKEDKSKIDIGEGEDYFWLRNQDILSIITKEQFESIQFKVKRIRSNIKKECEKESAIKPSGYKGLIEKKE